MVSVLEGTIFFRSRVPLLAWFYALLLFSNSSFGMRGKFIRKQLGLGVGCATRLCNRIRMHMAALPRPQQLGGPGKCVYIDETLVSNIVTGHLTEQRSQAAIVFGLACDDQVISGIISDRSKFTLVPILERYVVRGSTIVSDGLASYQCLAKRGWKHIVVNHSVAFHDFEGNTLNIIETYWRVLKRALKGHGTIHNHNLWLYLAEVEFRYNQRRSPHSIFDIVIGRFPTVDREEARRLKLLYDWR
jgi:transposase-like protein